MFSLLWIARRCPLIRYPLAFAQFTLFISFMSLFWYCMEVHYSGKSNAIPAERYGTGLNLETFANPHIHFSMHVDGRRCAVASFSNQYHYLKVLLSLLNKRRWQKHHRIICALSFLLLLGGDVECLKHSNNLKIGMDTNAQFNWQYDICSVLDGTEYSP